MVEKNASILEQVDDNINSGTSEVQTTETHRTLNDIWNKLVQHSQIEQETVLALREPKKRDQGGASKNTIRLRELGESSFQVNRYTHLVTAVRLSLRHLSSGGATTLRDIYYRDVAAFGGKQANLNAALQLMCQSLSLSLAADLRILPSPKGLVWGGNFELDFGCSSEPILFEYDSSYKMIPYLEENCCIMASKIPDVIVVMEKEAVFKSFCEYTRENKVQENVLVLTGRGFPDIMTRKFLAASKKAFPQTPVLYFVDCDVYGIRILWTYQEFTLPCSDKSNDVFAGVFLLDNSDGLLPISSKERRLIIGSLQLNESRRRPPVKVEEECEPSVIEEKVTFQSQNENFTCMKLLGSSDQTSQKLTENINPANSDLQPLPLPLPLPSTTRKLSSWRNAEIIHRELTRGILLGAKAEMNVLSDHISSAQYLNQYLWSKIRRAGELKCSERCIKLT